MRTESLIFAAPMLMVCGCALVSPEEAPRTVQVDELPQKCGVTFAFPVQQVADGQGKSGTCVGS